MSVQTKFEGAATGLLMMSESDYPFTYFTANGAIIDDSLILSLAEQPAGTVLEKVTIDHLLRNLTNTASGSVNAQTAQKFSSLAAVLKQELTDLTVYRVGEVQVDVFIIGLSTEGNIAGMSTKLIET